MQIGVLCAVLKLRPPPPPPPLSLSHTHTHKHRPAFCQQFTSETLDYFSRAKELAMRVRDAYPDSGIMFTGLFYLPGDLGGLIAT